MNLNSESYTFDEKTIEHLQTNKNSLLLVISPYDNGDFLIGYPEYNF
jgi:hypothetical protein